MGLLDKASEIVDGATHAVGGAVGGVLPGIDVGQLREVVDLVWSNKDALIELITRLPTLLGDAGESMHVAGKGARQASALLSSDVHNLAIEAADTLDALGGPLSQVADVLSEMGRLLDRVPLVGNVASPVTRGLGALSEVTAGIDSVSVQIRSLGSKLGDVGAGLDAMGGSLEGGGAALAALSGRRLGEPAAKASGPPTKPKSPAKKAAKRSGPKATT